MPVGTNTQTNTQSQATGSNSQYSQGAGTAYSGNGNAINFSGASVSGEIAGDSSITYNLTDPADQGLVALGNAAVQDSAALAWQSSVGQTTAVLAAERLASDVSEQASELSRNESQTPIQQVIPLLLIGAAAMVLVVIYR